MADVPRPGDWIQLRARPPVSDDALTTVPVLTAQGDASGLLLGIDAAQNLHLMIPVQHAPKGKVPPDLNGVKVRHRRLESGNVLDLMATPAHEPFFNPLCQSVIEAVLDEGRDPWRAVDSLIRAWRSAWQATRAPIEKIVQVGLFGELFFLKQVLIPCLGPAAVDHWSGPSGERHDFVVPGRLHIEVKTTRRSRHEHEISRLDQLHTPQAGRLVLASIQLEESLAGEHSLATLFDELVERLRGAPAALDLLAKQMTQMGWSEDMRNSVDLLRFNVRDAVMFRVDEEFPRLPQDFKLPSGITGIRYTVDLANLPVLDLAEVMDLVRQADSHSA
jgi:hypothetical protein